MIDVDVSIEPPSRFVRSQVALRLAVLIALSALRVPVTWGFCALFVLLPVIAAVVISSRGTEGYLASEGGAVLEVLDWWTGLVAYLLFLIDRFPLQRSDYENVRLRVERNSRAGVGVALLRLLTSLPVLILLAPLWWLAGVVWVLAAVSVLVVREVPALFSRYFVFVTTLQARLLVYHACLTDRYPLFLGTATRDAH